MTAVHPDLPDVLRHRLIPVQTTLYVRPYDLSWYLEVSTTKLYNVVRGMAEQPIAIYEGTRKYYTQEDALRIIEVFNARRRKTNRP